MKNVHILVTPDFKPYDPEPEGYLAWHAWAEVQAKAKIPNRCCSTCGKWEFDHVACHPGAERYTARQHAAMIRRTERMVEAAYPRRSKSPAPSKRKAGRA